MSSHMSVHCLPATFPRKMLWVIPWLVGAIGAGAAAMQSGTPPDWSTGTGTRAKDVTGDDSLAAIRCAEPAADGVGMQGIAEPGEGPGYFLIVNGEVAVEVPKGMVFVEAAQSSTKAEEVGQAAFWIGRYAVTNAEYQTYLAATGAARYPAGWVNSAFPAGKARHPVVGVSYDEALAYCAWAGAATGREITLPTAGQLHRAARGARVSLPVLRRTSFLSRPVGADPADCSVYGCCDLLGGVPEWSLDDEDDFRAVTRLHGF